MVLTVRRTGSVEAGHVDNVITTGLILILVDLARKDLVLTEINYLIAGRE